MKFRKKPVEIDAFRLGHDPVPEWAKTDQFKIYKTYAQVFQNGLLVVDAGEYIIKEPCGKISKCSAGEFESQFIKIIDPETVLISNGEEHYEVFEVRGAQGDFMAMNNGWDLTSDIYGPAPIESVADEIFQNWGLSLVGVVVKCPLT